MKQLETNWAGNHVYRAQQLVRPQTLEELREVVGRSRQVRALGSRHSFTDLADTDGALVSLAALPAEVEIDSARRLVRVSAGVTYAHLATALHRAGWALGAMASLPHITVAGAVATGTHGSGKSVGSLSSAVTALELVGPDGESRTSRRGEPDFDGHVISLGALGVVTSLTLDIEPTFDVRQDIHVGLRWADLHDHLDAILDCAYSVSVVTDWNTDERTQVWVKSRLPGTDAAFADPMTSLALPGLTPSRVTRPMLPGAPEEGLTPQLGEPGPWHERLPHFRMEFAPSGGAELQSEYYVPRARAAEAALALRGTGGELAPLLQASEIRTVAADHLWLSGSYGADAVAFHFTWNLDPEGVYAVLPVLEAALDPFELRPHWGKCFTLEAPRLTSLYPRSGDFVALRDQIDPDRKFSNAYLERCLG